MEYKKKYLRYGDPRVKTDWIYTQLAGGDFLNETQGLSRIITFRRGGSYYKARWSDASTLLTIEPLYEEKATEKNMEPIDTAFGEMDLDMEWGIGLERTVTATAMEIRFFIRVYQ